MADRQDLPSPLPDDHHEPSLLHRAIRRWRVILLTMAGLVAGLVIGAAGKTSTTPAATTYRPVPGPTVTVTAPATASAAPAPTVTTTVTASPSSNSGGGSGSGNSPSVSGAQTVTFIVYGDGSAANVTYGPAGSDDTGTEPMDVTEKIPSSPPAYYAIQAQLQGSGTVSVIIKVDGVQISSGVANGGYNIASAEIGQDPLTGQWQDDNS